MTPEKLPSVISARPRITSGRLSTSESEIPAAAIASPPSATACQPRRSAMRPASGPDAPITHTRKTSAVTDGESENGGRSSRKSM